MFKNYFLTTIHTLRQNPLYTALSVFGVALTFVFVCILFLMMKHSKGDYLLPRYAERSWQVGWLEGNKKDLKTITDQMCETWISQMKTPEAVLVTANEKFETVIVGDVVAMLGIQCVSENYYDVCGFRFLHGRPINKQEIADAVPVAVIDEYTRDLHFKQGGDPIGQNVELNGVSYKVVGVVENASLFDFNARVASANMWVPGKTITQDVKKAITFTAKDEASVADMQAEFKRILAETSITDGIQYDVPDWGMKTLKEQQGPPPLMSFLGCLVLMLIPALNILSLNVSRSFDRTTEIAVRKAFGATLPTIFGQLFLENVLITFAGAMIGMCLTPPILHAIDRMIFGFSMIPMSLSLRFDWFTILLVAGPCVLLFSFLSGSVPAWITAKREIVYTLKGEAQ